MKRLISVILFANLVSSCAFADEGTYYLKGGVGLNHINKSKFSNHAFEGKVKLANKFPLVELGIGYNLTESIRAELLFDYYFLFCSNEKSKDIGGNIYQLLSKTKAP